MIGYKQRALAVGMNRSGKSELMRYVFASINVRRFLVDPKGEWELPGLPRHVLRARDLKAAEKEVAAIDFAQPIVHIQPEWLEWEQLEALFDKIAATPGEHFTWVDECYGVSTKSRCPRGLNKLIVAGAGLGHGVGGCTQRPVNIAKVFLTEADHVMVFPPLGEDDLREALSGVPFLTPNHAAELMAPLPAHGYLWADKREKKIAVGPPLPPEYLTWKTNVVRKR